MKQRFASHNRYADEINAVDIKDKAIYCIDKFAIYKKQLHFYFSFVKIKSNV
ncbi:MAG: hypothetical protein PWQ67_2717 [Clostridia bacterium]|jgi:hypothetical protein|uniref:Uncharacterized protein n=1 Tax=Caldanaerobacter subterraneus subsp. tengcongensis (strain DSM 15242 / JCM 11007 / NBRC 100824 / MB4) TaxID=273068 RepID=Q8R7Z0_CALS4|nr:hypothetical protein TTE2250 [Caldanaerobacter subterraneus subsp. tengcongensis MB4]MDI3519972.1 hypothetical protein [Caldanaerobacter sp.]MDN5324263.1 hypothetical protein [Clostridia bacterium]